MSEENKYYIYSLKDPITGEIKYIGRTNNPNTRFISHISCAKDTPISKWIFSMMPQGKIPIMEIIEICHSIESRVREAYYIDLFLKEGTHLLNVYKKIEAKDKRKTFSIVVTKEAYDIIQSESEQKTGPSKIKFASFAIIKLRDEFEEKRKAAAILEAESKKPTGTSKVKYASAAILEKHKREGK